MSLRAEGNRLLDGSKVLHEFAAPIYEYKSYAGRGIVVLTWFGKGHEPRNLFLLDFDGTVKWQSPPVYSTGIDPLSPNSGARPDYFSGVGLEDGKLVVFATFGNEFIADWETGALTYYRWVK